MKSDIKSSFDQKRFNRKLYLIFKSTISYFCYFMQHFCVYVLSFSKVYQLLILTSYLKLYTSQVGFLSSLVNEFLMSLLVFSHEAPVYDYYLSIISESCKFL